jgi:hypothetical protein
MSTTDRAIIIKKKMGEGKGRGGAGGLKERQKYSPIITTLAIIGIPSFPQRPVVLHLTVLPPQTLKVLPSHKICPMLLLCIYADASDR